MSSIALPVGGLRAVLSLLDAKGVSITGPDFTAAGGTMVVASSNKSFATVIPTAGGDNVTSFDILPFDPTAQAAGSSVISFTATDADGTQAVGTITVADTDDVVSLSITTTPITPSPSSSTGAAATGA